LATYIKVVAALGLALIAAPAGMASAVAASTPPAGLVRLANFGPDGPGPGIDIYLDGTRWLSGEPYKAVSAYRRVSPGAHRFDVRAAGASSASSPVGSLTQTVSDGTYSTVAAAGRWSQLSVVGFADGFSSPGADKAQVRAIHLAPEVPAVDITVAGGPTLFSSLAFPVATTYLTVPAATYHLQFHSAGLPDILLDVPPVNVKAGAIESLIGTGGVGRPVEVVQLLDAAAAPATGGVGTGEGGMAVRTYVAALVALSGLAMIAAVLWVGRPPARATQTTV
jgi:hypothetical protein